MDPFADVPPPSAAAVKSANDLHNKLKTASPALVKDFDSKYEAWKKTWFSNENQVSPDSDSRDAGEEWDALVALGPKILPFIVHRLTSGGDFVAVALYMENKSTAPRNSINSTKATNILLKDNYLETDLCYKLDPQDILNTKRAATRIINMNFTRNTEVKEALDQWAAFRAQRQNYSSSFHFCEGEGYWALADMGPSIIAQMMLEYYNDKHGWWHELLHELVHGEVSNAGVFFKDQIFEEWKDWFDCKDHKDAPQGEDQRARRPHGPGRE